MAIKINAREQNLKVGKTPGYYYVMTPELYSSLKVEKVLKEAAAHTSMSEAVLKAAWDAAGEVIMAWATEGHSVPVPGLGTMRFTVRSKAVADVNDVKSNLIKTRRIVFTPSVTLKDELARTSIEITCYDRTGKIVKRVNSADSGEVEDPENEGGDGTNTSQGEGNDNGGTNTGGNTGGGDNNGDNNGGGTTPPGGGGGVDQN